MILNSSKVQSISVMHSRKVFRTSLVVRSSNRPCHITFLIPSCPSPLFFHLSVAPWIISPNSSIFHMHHSLLRRLRLLSQTILRIMHSRRLISPHRARQIRLRIEFLPQFSREASTALAVGPQPVRHDSSSGSPGVGAWLSSACRTGRGRNGATHSGLYTSSYSAR